MNYTEDIDRQVNNYNIAELNSGLDRQVLISHMKKTINQNGWNTYHNIHTYTYTRG